MTTPNPQGTVQGFTLKVGIYEASLPSTTRQILLQTPRLMGYSSGNTDTELDIPQQGVKRVPGKRVGV